MGERKNKSSLDRIERRILCNLLLIVAAYAFGVCLGVSMDKTDRKRVDMEQTDVIKCILISRKNTRLRSHLMTDRIRNIQ